MVSALGNLDDAAEAAIVMNADAAVGETQVVVTGPAQFTVTTAEMKWHGHPVANAEALHLAADFDDRASELVAGHAGSANSSPSHVQWCCQRCQSLRQIPQASV